MDTTPELSPIASYSSLRKPTIGVDNGYGLIRPRVVLKKARELSPKLFRIIIMGVPIRGSYGSSRRPPKCLVNPSNSHFMVGVHELEGYVSGGSGRVSVHVEGREELKSQPLVGKGVQI